MLAAVDTLLRGQRLIEQQGGRGDSDSAGHESDCEVSTEANGNYSDRDPERRWVSAIPSQSAGKYGLTVTVIDDSALPRAFPIQRENRRPSLRKVLSWCRRTSG